MLPMVASLAMAALARRATRSSAGGVQLNPSGGGGGLMDMLGPILGGSGGGLGGLLAGGGQSGAGGGLGDLLGGLFKK